MVLHSKLRSWLTILGIIIGVASVIAIVAIGDGLEAEITAQFDDGGGDILTISPGVAKASTFGSGRNKDSTTTSSSTADQDPLTRIDVQALKGISDVLFIDTKISGEADVYFLGYEGTVTISGIDQKVYPDIIMTDLLEGREFTPSDSNVIIIGNDLAKEYFEKEIGLNQMLVIEGKSFRVIGILDDSSKTVYMPINSAYSVLDTKVYGEYDSIQIKIRDQDRLDEIESVIDKKLMMVRHVNEDSKDFTLTSNAAAAESRADFLSTMTLFLTAIAGVSLVVGAVGVANTMFTSVLEKTKEIGILKAIGARNADILMIFVFNSALIGLVGGIFGVMLGYILIQLMTLVGMTAIVSVVSVLQILGLSVGIGMISGIIPAVNASKLKPVDALRSD